MTELEKMIIRESPTIGYWSEQGGIELKKIEHGIEDYAICVSSAWYGKKFCHRVKIYYTNKGPCIYIRGQRLCFKDCIKQGGYGNEKNLHLLC